MFHEYFKVQSALEVFKSVFFYDEYDTYNVLYDKTENLADDAISHLRRTSVISCTVGYTIGQLKNLFIEADFCFARSHIIYIG